MTELFQTLEVEAEFRNKHHRHHHLLYFEKKKDTEKKQLRKIFGKKILFLDTKYLWYAMVVVPETKQKNQAKKQMKFIFNFQIIQRIS